MKRFAITLILFTIFVLNPFLALAQEDEELELEEYVQEDELYRFSYPTGWFVRDYRDEFGGAPYISIVNDEMLLESNPGSMAIPEDMAGLNVTFVTLDMIAADLSSDLNLDEMTPEEISQAFMDMLADRLSANEPTEGIPLMGEPALWELDDDTSIPVLPFTIEAEGSEGIFMIFEVADGVYAFATAAAYFGKMAEYEEAFLAILQSLEVGFTAEDLTGMYMGEPEDFAATEEPGN